MNLAFSRDVVPLMFFPMMGQDNNGNSWGFDRFDDIWAGVFSKKVMDHLGWSVINGSPQVEHKKASLTKHNLEKEKSGIEMNELLWKAIDEVQLTRNTAVECYRELAEKVVFPKNEYFDKLKRAMIIWAELFR